MAKENRLTVLIPCKNEEKNIRECIESVLPIADEVLVADSGSTDRTMDIAREYPICRIVEREYITSGDFKNWAIPQAAYPWVFIIDADERVTAELADEINEILHNGPSRDGYVVYRQNHFMGHPVYYSGSRTDDVLRLFRRDLGRYEGPSDHGDIVVPTGRVGRLQERMLHYTYWTYDQYFQKFNRYTTLQAQQWYAEGRRPSYVKMLCNPAMRFFRHYVLQGGFRDGYVGLQISLLSGFYSFMKQARLWELHHAQPQPNPEAEREQLSKTKTIDSRRAA